MTHQSNGFACWRSILRCAPRLLMLVVAVMVTAGCPAGSRIHFMDPDSHPQGKVSIHEMAGHLSLRVTESTSLCAVLRNPRNNVTIFSDPQGQAFVNGRPVGEPGGIIAVDDIIFVPLELEQDIHLAMREMYVPPRVEPPPQLPQPPRPLRKTQNPGNLGLVVIDPGHGGKDSGTTVLRGNPEKDINLAVALAVAEQLRSQGVQAVLTRRSDTFVDLDERARIANRLNAKLFVAIHSDSVSNRAIQGHTVITPMYDRPGCVSAAKLISGRLVDAGMSAHGVRRDVRGLRVLKETTGPAVLVEIGYLSNASEAARLTDPAYQQRMATAIADGIVTFLQRP